jgi:hypothetical protein
MNLTKEERGDEGVQQSVENSLCVFVDVDETLVRNYGAKRIPIPSVIEHVQSLWSQGVMLFCWSSGGAEYARNSAQELKIENCFQAFLPKPQVLLDDVKLSGWRYLIEVHPNTCDGKTQEDYRKLIRNIR